MMALEERALEMLNAVRAASQDWESIAGDDVAIDDLDASDTGPIVLLLTRAWLAKPALFHEADRNLLAALCTQLIERNPDDALWCAERIASSPGSSPPSVVLEALDITKRAHLGSVRATECVRKTCEGRILQLLDIRLTEEHEVAVRAYEDCFSRRSVGIADFFETSEPEYAEPANFWLDWLDRLDGNAPTQPSIAWMEFLRRRCLRAIADCPATTSLRAKLGYCERQLADFTGSELDYRCALLNFEAGKAHAMAGSVSFQLWFITGDPEMRDRGLAHYEAYARDAVEDHEDVTSPNSGRPASTSQPAADVDQGNLTTVMWTLAAADAVGLYLGALRAAGLPEDATYTTRFRQLIGDGLRLLRILAASDTVRIRGEVAEALRQTRTMLEGLDGKLAAQVDATIIELFPSGPPACAVPPSGYLRYSRWPF